MLAISLRVIRPFPLAAVQSREQCRVFLDRNGDVVRVELGADEQWRIPVALERISPRLVQATLAVEDQRYFEHGGIDWVAVVRAALGNIRHGRVVSGASTITMQLGRLSAPDEPWGWTRKLRQVSRALHVEFVRDKSWILERYLNLAPYGGNIVGCEAAARFYFGKPAAELTVSEAALVAGIPQHPVWLRPDRHPQAARRRWEHVLHRMAVEGFIDSAGLSHALAQDPVGGILARRRALGGRLALGLPVEEPIFCRLAARETGDAIVRMTLDGEIQSVLRTALTERVAQLPGVMDGAGVVIENQTGAVRALVGTLDFREPRRGEVNAAMAVRAPGSALKPFVYLLALERGLILPHTRVMDEPLGYADYRPGNFDGAFRGSVTAIQALSESLNTPAVRLLEAVGTGELLDFLKRCGLSTLPDTAAECGLALALGGVGVRLVELTGAYAVLARSWRSASVRFTRGGKDSDPDTRIFSVGATRLLRDMLGARPLPGAQRRGVCWKTGTSSGFRDAWCFAFDSRYTVGIWLGNKSGASSPELIGIRAAGPVATQVMNALTEPGVAAWPQGEFDDDSIFCPVAVCAETGLQAGAYCRDRVETRGLRSATLRGCDACAGRAAVAGGADTVGESVSTGTAEKREVRNVDLLIQCPSPTTYRALDGRGVSLACAAVGVGDDAEWFVDGVFAGRGKALPRRFFGGGRHLVVCSDPDSGANAQVEFSVEVEP